MQNILNKIIKLGALALISLFSLSLLANDDSGDIEEDANPDNRVGLSLDEIALELSNPVSKLFSIRNEFEYRLYQGSLADASDESAFIYNFQASTPIPLENGKTIQIRFNVPVNGTQPIYEFGNKEISPFLIRQNASTIPTNGTFDNSHGHSHLGDVSFDVAYGGVSENGFMLAGDLPTIHSTKLVLVDSDRKIRGYYDSFDEESLRLLTVHVRELLYGDGL